MTLFSERHKLADVSPIEDEAPEWLRVTFINQILMKYLHTDRSNNSFSDPSASVRYPVGIKWLIERLSGLTRLSPPRDYLYDHSCLDALGKQILSLEWFHFYDLIELVTAELQLAAGSSTYGRPGFANAFREQINKLFAEQHVNWRLDAHGHLQRVLAPEIQQMERSEMVDHQSDPSSVNLAKARRFLDQRPSDSANSIKESVSAVESLGRTLVPGASTLGDAIKHLRTLSNYPPLMLTLVEKMYAFANAEPAVRHGSPQEERVTRADAEFVYVTALATMKYFRELRN